MLLPDPNAETREQREHRKLLEREMQLEEIASLSARGYGIAQIAMKTGRLYGSVYSDLRICRDRWREKTQRSIDEWIDEEIRKLDEIEKTYWAAYEASRYDRNGDLKLDSEGNPKQGNTIHLSGILQCINQRNRIMGIADRKTDDADSKRGKGTIEELAEAIRKSRELTNDKEEDTDPRQISS